MKKIENNNKNTFSKKIFSKIIRFFGFEIIDQNNFYSPSLKKNLNEDLSTQGDKSIVIPTGKVAITRKVKSIFIVFRSCANVKIWSQSKERVFEKEKIEYTKRSLNSVVNSINYTKDMLPNVNIELCIVDDHSSNENVAIIKKVTETLSIKKSFINLNKDEFTNLINKKIENDTFGNLASLYKCCLIAKEKAEDLVFFVEDDYLHQKNTIYEMIMTYERLASQLNREIFLCPSDYPYLYKRPDNTNVLLGNALHWQIIRQSLCTFLTSKSMMIKYWQNFIKTCEQRNDPFEKHLHEIYDREYCFSPIPSLSIHLANINSSYGVSPYIDLKKLWDESELD